MPGCKKNCSLVPLSMPPMTRAPGSAVTPVSFGDHPQPSPAERVSSPPCLSSLTSGGSDEWLGPVSLHLCNWSRGRAAAQCPDRRHLGVICQSASLRVRRKGGRQGASGEYPVVVRAAESISIGPREKPASPRGGEPDGRRSVWTM